MSPYPPPCHARLRRYKQSPPVHSYRAPCFSQLRSPRIPPTASSHPPTNRALPSIASCRSNSNSARDTSTPPQSNPASNRSTQSVPGASSLQKTNPTIPPIVPPPSSAHKSPPFPIDTPPYIYSPDQTVDSETSHRDS